MHLAQSVSSRGSKKPIFAVCISWQSWHDVFRWGLGLRSNNLGVESNQAITLLLRFWAKDSLCFNIWRPSEILKRDLYKIFQTPWRWAFSMGVSGINWKTRKFTAFSTTNAFRCVRRWEADLLPKMHVGEHQGGNACFCSMLLCQTNDTGNSAYLLYPWTLQGIFDKPWRPFLIYHALGVGALVVVALPWTQFFDHAVGARYNHPTSQPTLAPAFSRSEGMQGRTREESESVAASRRER